MTSTLRPIALAVILLGPLVCQAPAALVVYTGADLNAGPGSPTPSSTAAAASFDAAAATLGTSSVITFESAALGSFHNLTVVPGVTITGADLNLNDQTIKNTPNATFPSLDGFNTTAGGAKFVEMFGGTLVFTFAQPTQFFGAYLTGVQTAFYADNFTFSDGTSQTILVPGAGTANNMGEVAFVGFTDAGKSITSITITAGGFNGADAIGVDDVRYQSATPSGTVPEPSSLALTGIAAALALATARARRQRIA